MWQDFVFTAGSVAFIVALIPTIRSTEKPPLFTSALTGFILGVFAVLYLTLDLYFSAVTTAVTSLCWWIIFFLKAKKWTPHEHDWETMSWKHFVRTICGKEMGQITEGKQRCRGCGKWETHQYEGVYTQKELGWV